MQWIVRKFREKTAKDSAKAQVCLEGGIGRCRFSQRHCMSSARRRSDLKTEAYPKTGSEWMRNDAEGCSFRDHGDGNKGVHSSLAGELAQGASAREA